MGEDARALADLDRAIALEPQEPTYYSIKAQIYLRQGKTAEALAMLDQGIAVKPDNVYRKLGDTKQEEAALTRLIALDPKSQLGLLLRAFLYERLGKPDLASILAHFRHLHPPYSSFPPPGRDRKIYKREWAKHKRCGHENGGPLLSTLS